MKTDTLPPISEWYEAMRSLCDHQNGCPLPKYEKPWNAAMEECMRLMAIYEHQSSVPSATAALPAQGKPKSLGCSAGALRAAQYFANLFGNPVNLKKWQTQRQEFAVAIDSLTGLPELLEACRDGLTLLDDTLTTFQDSYKIEEFPTMIRMRSAINTVEGK